MAHRTRRLSAAMHDARLEDRPHPARVRLLDVHLERRLVDGDLVEPAHYWLDLGELLDASPFHLASVDKLVVHATREVQPVEPVAVLACVTHDMERHAVLARDLDPVPWYGRCDKGSPRVWG